MDLRDLRYFETIAELQHLGRAAVKLHRTQPALTSSVRRLEADCGAALFEKAGRGIQLTEAGRVLLKWAKRMRFDVEDARRELQSIGAGLSGQLRMGIVPTAAQFLLPAVARQLLAEAPEVSLRTVVGLVDTLRPQLRAGELDMVIGTEGAPEAGWVNQPLADDMIVVAAAERHAVFRQAATLKDLTAHAWALQPPGAPTRDWLDHTFDRHGLPRPRVRVETTMLLMFAHADRANRAAEFHLAPPPARPRTHCRAQGGAGQRRRHEAPAGGDLSGEQLPFTGCQTVA
jgi:DNA-binding transcriptional LysR family regulator